MIIIRRILAALLCLLVFVISMILYVGIMSVLVFFGWILDLAIWLLPQRKDKVPPKGPTKLVA